MWIGNMTEIEKTTKLKTDGVSAAQVDPLVSGLIYFGEQRRMQ